MRPEAPVHGAGSVSWSLESRESTTPGSPRILGSIGGYAPPKRPASAPPGSKFDAPALDRSPARACVPPRSQRSRRTPRLLPSFRVLLFDAMLGKELFDLLLARDRRLAPQVHVGRDPPP